jgi:hypothetical protein
LEQILKVVFYILSWLRLEICLMDSVRASQIITVHLQRLIDCVERQRARRRRRRRRRRRKISCGCCGRDKKEEDIVLHTLGRHASSNEPLLASCQVVVGAAICGFQACVYTQHKLTD